jgi:hypothetical protein
MTKKPDAGSAAPAEPSREELSREAAASVWGTEETTTADPKPAPAPEADPEPAPAAAAAEQNDPPADDEPPADDIWAKAPEPLRNAWTEKVAEFDRLQSTWDRQRNQTSGLSRKIEEQAREIEKLKKTPKAAEPPAAPSFDELETQLSALREEFPDIAGPVDALAKILRSQASRFDEVSDTSQAALSRSLEAEETKVDAAHPGWFALITDERKDDWAAFVEDEEQPAWVRRAAEKNAEAIVDAASASKLLTRFKEHLGLNPPPPAEPADTETRTDDKRQRQLRGAASAPTRGTQSGSADPVTTDRKTNQAWAAA